MNRLLACTAALLCLTSVFAQGEPPMTQDKISYIDNGVIRVGVNLGLGGAITYVSKSGSEENLINSADWGRQIQMSHYSGPVPFAPNGKQPQKVWEGLGWNPIQCGDCFGNRSKILTHTNDGKALYVKCIPMQWPLNNEPGECTFECWITLEGNAIQVRARTLNNRSDKTQYQGRDQELPAIYTNAPWYRLMTYSGDKPFTNDNLREIPPQFPWASWQGTENWAALINEAGNGIGVWEPGVYSIIGGFAGKPGKGGPKDGPTGYIAPLHREILDHNIDYNFKYTLIVGSIVEIRQYVYAHAERPKAPSWRFDKDRQHWIYVNATDAGWPITGELKIALDGGDPQMLSPTAFWQAADAPRLYIEAAFTAERTNAEIFWSRADAPGFAEGRTAAFAIIPDGQYHVYEVDLSASPEYRGSITGLRIDPTPGGKPGEFVRVKSVGFQKPPA